MSIDAVPLEEDPLAAESPDFILDPREVDKGAQAVAQYLESLKGGEGRRSAEEALDTLALLFTDGQCNANEFPWQQVKAYHGAAALQILKEPGTPAKLESLRLGRDPNRKYRQVPSQYGAKHVQKLRTSLRRILSECHRLGYLTAEERDQAVSLPKATEQKPARGRILSDSEFRALTSACDVDGSTQGSRDALILILGYQAGLRVGEMVALSVKDLRFDSRRGKTTVYVKGTQGRRGRTVPLQNGGLIALEDWLEARGDADGPLLCPVRKGGKVEVRRMTAADLRQVCNKRAEEAGVQAFSPNDLRASAVPTRTGGRARRARAQRPTSNEELAALYALEPEADESQSKIHFPYRTRKLELL